MAVTRIAAEIDLDAPVERVFAVVTDADRLGDWIAVHRDVDEAPGLPLRRGDAFEQRVEVKGARIPIVWTASSVQAPRHVAWTGEGPGGARATARVDLEPLADGRTHLVYVCEYEPPGGAVGAAADRLAGRRAATEEAEASFARLRTLLAGG